MEESKLSFINNNETQINNHSPHEKECHCCKLIAGEPEMIICNKKECSSLFCITCVGNKYKELSKKVFDKLRKNNKWICFKCKLVCNCQPCRNKILSENNDTTNVWYLNKKRSRISNKIRKCSKAKLQEINDNTQNHKDEYNTMRIKINTISQSQEVNELNTSQKEKYDTIDKDFPNYSKNILLNQLICKAASLSSASSNKSTKKKSNKPCILCTKFKCPTGIEILKFKTYEDYNMFLSYLFKETQNEADKLISNDNNNNSHTQAELNQIFKHSKKYSKLQESLKQSSLENKLKGPKRFCSNCVANRLHDNNCIFDICNNLKDEDEQPSLEPKKKLEIVEGINTLITKCKEIVKPKDKDKDKDKEKDKDAKEKANIENQSLNYIREGALNNNHLKNNNIFNQIFNKPRNKNEGDLDHFGPSITYKENMLMDCNKMMYNEQQKSMNINLINLNNLNYRPINTLSDNKYIGSNINTFDPYNGKIPLVQQSNEVQEELNLHKYQFIQNQGLPINNPNFGYDMNINNNPIINESGNYTLPTMNYPIQYSMYNMPLNPNSFLNYQMMNPQFKNMFPYEQNMNSYYQYLPNMNPSFPTMNPMISKEESLSRIQDLQSKIDQNNIESNKIQTALYYTQMELSQAQNDQQKESLQSHYFQNTLKLQELFSLQNELKSKFEYEVLLFKKQFPQNN